MSENLEAKDRIKNLMNKIQDDVVHQTTSTKAPTGDKNVVLDGSGSGHDDIPTKKKKTRRGKNKRRYSANPYPKLTLQQRMDMQKKKGNRRRSRKILAHKQALAPYNSNQFLIEDHDHGYLQEIEERLKSRIERYKSRSGGQTRTRDSSFSLDSDVDYYSSPEDEEEFLTREFSNTYQDIRTERLNSMTREELVQECIQMENRLEMLTKCISGGKSPGRIESKDNDVNISRKDNGIMVDISSVPDFQLQIMKLMNENDALRRENERLRKARHPHKRGSVSSSMSSSVDSESDSSSGSSSSDSESSDDEHKIRENTRSPSPQETLVDYSKTNGYASSPQTEPSTPQSEDVTEQLEINCAPEDDIPMVAAI